jgi:hypothetical protein
MTLTASESDYSKSLVCCVRYKGNRFDQKKYCNALFALPFGLDLASLQTFGFKFEGADDRT